MLRNYSRSLSVLAISLSFGASLFAGVQAAPTRPTSTAHASSPLKPSSTASPAAISYEGSFLKTLERAPAAPADWHPLQDKFGRFALAVPSDWSEGSAPQDQPGMMYALVAGEIQPRDGFSANLVVSQTQAPPKFVMKPSMVATLSTQMTKDMKAYQYVVKDKAFTYLDGIPCVIIGGTLEVDGHSLRNLQLRLVHRGFNYLVTFTAFSKYYGQYEPLFARLAKSLVFERETPSPSPSASATPTHE